MRMACYRTDDKTMDGEEGESMHSYRRRQRLLWLLWLRSDKSGVGARIDLPSVPSIFFCVNNLSYI